MIRASQGDVEAVRAWIEKVAARGPDGSVLARHAVERTMLLRARGHRDAEARQIAQHWADRLAALPQSYTPDPRGMHVYSDLFIAAERWPDALRSADADQARFKAMVARGVSSPLSIASARTELAARRAIVLVHLGRRSEALAIDSTLSRTVGTRWDRGRSALASARVAAHLGDRDRAVRLLEAAVSGGAIWWLAGYYVLPSVDMDPLLLPLRADPRFIALARPDPADVK